MVQPQIGIDIGIGELVRIIDERVNRRRQRRVDLVADVGEDAELAATIVRSLDGKFARIVRGYASLAQVNDRDQLAALNRTADEFFTSGRSG